MIKLLVMKSFLQTEDWLAFQKSTGKNIWYFNDGMLSANIIEHPLPFKKSFLYIPRGPIINERLIGKTKNEFKHFVNFLIKIANQQNALFVKFEPVYNIVPELLRNSNAHFVYSTKTIQPHKTMIIDLAQSELDLIGRMHHKTRYNIGLAVKKGLQLRESKDVKMFLSLMKKTSEHDKFSPHAKKYYERLISFFADTDRWDIKTRLFFVYADYIPIAGAIILEHEKTAYYLHGAMDRKYRSLMAPHFMHWELMKRYKKYKFSIYDFWGIDVKKWPGVTRFKLSFGGQVIEYPGAFDIPTSSTGYLMYKFARKARTLLYGNM